MEQMGVGSGLRSSLKGFIEALNKSDGGEVMLTLKSEYAKFIEELYLGIQVLVLIVLLVGISLLKTAVPFYLTFIFLMSYVVVLSQKFHIYIRYLETKDFIDFLRRPLYKVLDGIILGSAIYLYSAVAHSLINILYIFLIFQSLRPHSTQKFYSSIYAGIIYGILSLLQMKNQMWIDFLINVGIFFIMEYIISTVIGQIQLMHEQQAYYEVEMKNKNQKLEEMAFLDYLTHLHNHQSFYLYFEKLYKKSFMHKKPLTLTIIDIDNFKQVNDNYGHLAGDDILRDVAQMIGANIRKTDFIARYGGEEFAIVYPDTKLEDGVRVSEHLRKMVEKHVFVANGQKLQITISLGTGALAVDGEYMPYGRFIDEVDKLLYDAKHAGKNQVKYGLIA